jgi:creatinine amidohydrolase
MEKNLMINVTWQELEKFVKEDYILILVVGSLEQHGPHLPLGTDTFIPLEISKILAEKVYAVIAPPIYYSYYSQPRSGGGRFFVGSVGISGATLICIVKEIVEEFIKQGFRRILVLNGHYENSVFIKEGIEKAIEAENKKEVKAVIVNWWDLIPKNVIDSVFHGKFPGWDVEHASLTETSLMQVLKPDLVQAEKIIDDKPVRRVSYEILPPPLDIVPKSGVLWKATLASKTKGEIILNTIITDMLKILKVELNARFR